MYRPFYTHFAMSTLPLFLNDFKKLEFFLASLYIEM